MDENIKKEYDVLAKKYGLPPIEVLQKEFIFSEPEEHVPVLTGIRKKICEKVEYFIPILSEILNPDASIMNIYEYRNLDEKTKMEMFEAYKKLMSLSRQMCILSLRYDETGEADVIKQAHKNWDFIEKTLKKNISVLKKAWDKDEKPPKELINYWG